MKALRENSSRSEAGSAARHFSMSDGWRESHSCRTTATGMDSMSERYSEYLQSDAWKIKRLQRLSRDDFRCAACGTKKQLEVHHLTYDRIYNEDIGDLMSLCYIHHLAAEELVSKGLISRRGNVGMLAKRTIRLLNPRPVRERRGQRKAAKVVRNRIQEDLISEQWFMLALKLERKAFKNLVRRTFEGHPFRGRMLTNAFTLYDRRGWILLP